MVEKMTVQEVADIIGKPPQFVRLGIKESSLDLMVEMFLECHKSEVSND